MATYSSAQLERGPGQRRGESRRPGQWKLAYADFLTALMAFFLLMWLSSGTSADERAAIAAYFSGETAEMRVESASKVLLHPIILLRDQIDERLGASVVLSQQSDHYLVSTDGDLLRLDLTDLSGAPLFDNASGELTPKGEALVRALGLELGSLPVLVSIEGHTDAFPGAAGSNWALSLARAEAVRQTLTLAGMDSDAISAVTGYADTRPLLPTQPHAPVNRRVSLLIAPAM